MKRLLLATALLLCSGGVPFYADEKPAVEKKTPAPDAPSLKLPATVTGDPGDFIEITAETNGNAVAWRVVDKGLKMFPVSRLKDTKTAVVSSKDPGSYRVWAVTALGGVPSEIAECVVVVGTPVPPIPPPPPPGPVSDLTKALQAAYILDGPDQASLTMLTALFSGMAISVQTPEIQAKTGGTNAGASKWCKETIEAPITNLGTTKLVNVRKAIAAEVLSKWGAKVAPLSPADASKELAAIEQALRGVK